MLKSVISVLSILVMLSIEILTPFAYAVDWQGSVVVEDVYIYQIYDEIQIHKNLIKKVNYNKYGKL